jgi:hypothetical protein
MLTMERAEEGCTHSILLRRITRPSAVETTDPTAVTSVGQRLHTRSLTRSVAAAFAMLLIAAFAAVFATPPLAAAFAVACRRPHVNLARGREPAFG